MTAMPSLASAPRARYTSLPWTSRSAPPVPQAAEGMAQMALNHPKWFGVVAEVDGRMVGSNFLDQRDAIAAVGPITVDPSVHCKGIGRRLMQAVIDRAREGNHPGTRLVQEPFNTISLP